MNYSLCGMEGCDSWRSSSEIKDKCGYVSHVYSALQLTSCQTATGSLLAANLLCQLYLYKWINGSSVTLWTSCASRLKWCTAPIKMNLGLGVVGKWHSSLHLREQVFFFPSSSGSGWKFGSNSKYICVNFLPLTRWHDWKMLKVLEGKIAKSPHFSAAAVT